MPVAATISLTDAGVTPNVSRSFKPFDRSPNGRVEWRTDHEEVRNANFRLSVRQYLKDAGTPKAREMCVLTVSVPTMETLATGDNGFTPPPTVKWTEFAYVEFSFAESSSPQKRERILAFTALALQNVDIVAAFKNGERFRGI